MSLRVQAAMKRQNHCNAATAATMLYMSCAEIIYI